MKQLLLGLTLLLMTSTITMAQQGSLIKITATFGCIPTEIASQEINTETVIFEKLQIIGVTDAGTYEKWKIVNDGVESWALMLVTTEGITCKIDSGIISESSDQISVSPNSLDDLDTFKKD